jgi:hypothetical protein
MVVCMGLLGMLALAGGCGEGAAPVQDEATIKDKAEKLKDARKQALGATGAPVKGEKVPKKQ